MVIVTLGEPREKLWEQPSGPQIMRLAEQKGRLVDLEGLEGGVDNGRVLLATGSNDPKSLARGVLDPKATVDALDTLRSDQVLLLPHTHRLSSRSARRVRSVYDDTSINLFSASVRREIMDGQRPTYQSLADHDYSVDRALSAALESWQGPAPVGYRWRTRDGQSSVAWMQAIKGSWKSAYQNVVAWRVRVDELQAELTLGKDLRTGRPLVRYERQRKHEKMSRLQRSRARYFDDATFEQLPLYETDMVRVEGIPHWEPAVGGRPAHLHKWRFRTPSDDAAETRIVRLEHLPALLEDDSDYSLGMMYKMSATTSIPFEQFYDQWHAQSIAAVLSAQRIIDRSAKVKAYQRFPRKSFGAYDFFDLSMPHQPFIIPTRPLNDVAHRLWSQTAVTEYDNELERWTFRPLNEVEMDVCIGHWFLKRGYDKGATTDSRELRPQDPQGYLVKTRKAA